MNTYSLIAIIISLTAVIAYLNHRFFALPMSIGIMFGSMTLALLAMVLQTTGIQFFTSFTHNIVNNIDFHDLLMNGLLSFLLFAGSMNIDFKLLKASAGPIASLASFSVIASTFLLGSIMYFVIPLFSSPLPYLYCLLFGALISPTDPIAVLATFKKLDAPKKLNVIIAGESLFNDGVGIVVFITLYHLTLLQEPITWQHVCFLFLTQAIGGIAYGGAIGYAGHRLIQNSPPRIALLMTFAMTTGGYYFAQLVGISGPLAMVVAGIFIGNKARKGSKEDKTNNVLADTWELVDEILNAILFMLLGLELLSIHGTKMDIVTGVLSIPIALIVRYITVAIPTAAVFKTRQRPPRLNLILTWGGLRGGLAVALALSLPNSHYRNLILTMTFAIVAFAVIVQGTTVKSLLPDGKRAGKKNT